MKKEKTKKEKTIKEKTIKKIYLKETTQNSLFQEIIEIGVGGVTHINQHIVYDKNWFDIYENKVFWKTVPMEQVKKVEYKIEYFEEE